MVRHRDRGRYVHGIIRRGPSRLVHGFTLLEMAIVLALIAMLFGSAILSFRKPYQRAQFQSAVERIVDFDNRVRRGAASNGYTSHLTIDLDHDSLRATRWVQGIAKETSLTLPQGVQFEQVLTAENWVKVGRFVIPVDSIGASITYAIRVAGPTQVRWVLFMGGTGQHLILDDDVEIKQIFSQFFAARIDAD